MKDIKQYILENDIISKITLKESTESEDLQNEVSLALKEFGNVRNGFKMTPIDDIKDAMYKLGFDYDEKQSSSEKLVFVGEYIDNKYEIDLYAEDQVNGKIKIKNFNVFEES